MNNLTPYSRFSLYSLLLLFLSLINLSFIQPCDAQVSITLSSEHEDEYIGKGKDYLYLSTSPSEGGHVDTSEHSLHFWRNHTACSFTTPRCPEGLDYEWVSIYFRGDQNATPYISKGVYTQENHRRWCSGVMWWERDATPEVSVGVGFRNCQVNTSEYVVHSITWDNGEVTSLSADFKLTCSMSDGGFNPSIYGTVRYNMGTEAGYQLGDVNCSGSIGWDDLWQLWYAVWNPHYASSTNPLCDIGLADVNEDGKIGWDDYTDLFNLVNKPLQLVVQ